MSQDQDDFYAKLARHKEFMKTDLGKAFHKFDNAMAAYWRFDQDDRISDKRLKELSDKEQQARKEFLALLMKDFEGV